MGLHARPVVLGLVAIASMATVGLGGTIGQDAASQTAVIRFMPPSNLPPDRPAFATCPSPSRAAAFRHDAWTCIVGGVAADPCFATGRASIAWCPADPRESGTGVFVTMDTPLARANDAALAGPRVWFFVLTDGSTCRPLAAPGRVIEGETELYACKYGSEGEADAVLGELDSSKPMWTIHKVLINKKTVPQTVKSLTIASAKTVWQ